MSCVSLKIRKRMGNPPRDVALACTRTIYATTRFLAMRGTGGADLPRGERGGSGVRPRAQ